MRMSQSNTRFKPKKSVALSGTVAGNTALCSVGRSGNDLAYRGYDINDLAESCQFEEIAHLLIHGKLPAKDELDDYKHKLQGLRDLPGALQQLLELIPASAQPMDVLRCGCSVLGTILPEHEQQSPQGAKDIADRLLACFASMLVYWYHFSHNGQRINTVTDDDSIGAHFLNMLHGQAADKLWVKAMHISLILYAEHEFNASTFTSRVITGTGADIYSAVTGAIGALRGPKHGGANEVALAIMQRYNNADQA
ncbi:MAG: 2-methylcitrate synthase, partial [Gammaproteobacteria bacterium]|nr:2-methylcitrate synthase [Gammaproteobacteria bacterium]